MGRVDPIELKGVMIQRITTFIEWPECPKQSVVFAVYDEFQNVEKFKKIFSSQSINGKAVTVRYIRSLNDLESLSVCDIVCLGTMSMKERSKIVDRLSKKGILVIGNSRDDAKEGVAVSLIEDANRYKIVINADGLKNTNLKADYRLLKLAEIIEER